MNARSPGKLSISLNPIFLSRGDSACIGGDGDLGDGCSELVIVSFRGLVRTGATLVCWIPVVWREGTQSRGRNRGRLRYRLKPGVQLYWDQLPSSIRFGAAILELYLDYRCFSDGLQALLWDGR